MQMTLYKNKSDKRYINKTITQVGNIITTLYLKDDTEVVNPIIILDDFPNGVNYCYLDSFDRFYYLTDVTMLNGQIQTTWKVDVLMSYKNDIKNNKALVKRNTNYNDLYLQDSEFMVEQYSNDRYLCFSESPFSISSKQFVMAVLGS